MGLQPNSIRVAFCQRWSFEHSVDLRVVGISNEETYKDEQYVQWLAEQVQKLESTKRILKEGPLGDNILNEKAAKKIYEAWNCELHEIQKRTDKLQIQRWYSHVEAGFQVCHRGGNLNVSEEMLSCIQQKIQAAYMTFVEQSMLLIRGNSIFTKPKNLSEKIKAKGTYTSILDRFKNDEKIHTSQPEHNNWTEERSQFFSKKKTSEHSILRTTSLQNNEIDTPRSITFDTIQIFRETPYEKSCRRSWNYAENCQHEHTGGG